MSHRDEIHKKYVKENDIVKRNKLFIKYKKIRNSVLNITRLSKKLYHEKIFTENKNDMKAIWKEIKNVVNLNNKNSKLPPSFILEENCVSDKQIISNKFNEYFTKMGASIDQKNPTVEKNPMDYMSCRNPNNL